MAASSAAAADQTIGPLLAGKPDFTLRFEDWVFTILPTALLILATPIFLRRLVLKPAIVRGDILLPAKLVSPITTVCFCYD